MALSIDDILAFRSVSDVQLSPDGAQFAFVVSANHTTLDKADDGELRRCTGSAIWLCGAEPGSEPRQLTSGPALGSDSLPRWSPDGATLAFLSDRADVGGQRQIYTMPVPRGGSDDDGAQAVTDVQGDIPTPRGLNAVQWDPDGASIAFLLEETVDGQGERALGDDAIEYEAHEQFVRVNRLDLATSRVTPISPRAAGQIWEFAPGPGGKIAAVVSEAPFEWSWYGCRLVAFDGTEDAAVQELASPMKNGQSRQVAQPQWSPDGSRIAFITSTWSDRGCVAGTLMAVNADGTGVVELTPGIVASLGWSVWEPSGESLLSIGHERGGSGLHRVSADGSGTASLGWGQCAVAEGNWPRFSLAGGTIAVIREDCAHPRDVWLAEAADPLNWRQAVRC